MVLPLAKTVVDGVNYYNMSVRITIFYIGPTRQDGFCRHRLLITLFWKRSNICFILVLHVCGHIAWGGIVQFIFPQLWKLSWIWETSVVCGKCEWENVRNWGVKSIDIEIRLSYKT